MRQLKGAICVLHLSYRNGLVVPRWLNQFDNKCLNAITIAKVIGNLPNFRLIERPQQGLLPLSPQRFEIAFTIQQFSQLLIHT
jgi:hypothetical protein